MKYPALGLTFIFVANLQATVAAGPEAISFYRYPNSPFSSGQASFDILFNHLKQEKDYSYVQATKDSKSFSIERSSVLTEWDLSHQVIDLKTQNKCTIAEISNNQYRLDCPNKTTVWRNAEDINPWLKDLGRYRPWKITPFVEEGTKKTYSIYPDHSCVILGFQHQFARVMLLTPPFKIGFVYLNDGISKLDLSDFIMVDKKWQKVKFYNRDGIKLTNDKWISPSRIQAILTKPKTAIMHQAVPEYGLLQRSLITLHKIEFKRWLQSKIPDHGVVWWQSNSSLKNSALSFEDIKQKKITRVIHPQLKLLPSLVHTADSLYYTDDGLHYQELDTFKNKNFPSFIDEKNNLYIGYFKSSNNRKSFTPYLRPQDLTQFFATKHHSAIQIKDIDVTQNRIKIMISDGIQTKIIVGHLQSDFVKNWKVW